MNVGIPLLLGTFISFITLNIAEENDGTMCQVKDDLHFRAIDVKVKYKLRSEAENLLMSINGSATLNNCDVSDEKWRCNFDVENCDKSQYNYRLEAVNVSAAEHLEQIFEEIWWQTPEFTRAFYGPTAFHSSTQGKNQNKVWKQWVQRVFKVIKRNAPEHICPGRIPLYWYQEASKINDNVLSTIKNNKALLDKGYVMTSTHATIKNPIGFCSPQAGRCGATERLFQFETVDGATKKSYHKFTLKHGVEYEPLPCFLWP